MKYNFLIYFIILIFLILLSLCLSCQIADKEDKKFTIFNPYKSLSESDIILIGANGFTGSAKDIAEKIMQWQDNNMKYVGPDIKQDVSYPMRWNYIMPGIYPVYEMIRERKIMEDGKEKIYGLCWDYAAIFCAIAFYYKLEARITAYKKYMSNIPGGQTGLGKEEYDALLIKLNKNNIYFSYETINNSMKETYVHYRAEVYIDDKWEPFDATYPTGEYAVDSNYSPVEWDEGADPDLTE